MTPNRSRYQNAGRALLVLASRQREVGIRQARSALKALSPGSTSRARLVRHWKLQRSAQLRAKADGTARHQGLEASADWKWSDGGLLSATKLHARRLGAVDASLTNTTPPNVPASSIKAQWRHQITAGMQATVGLNHESSRFATPDNAYAIPAWTTLDLGLRLTQWCKASAGSGASPSTTQPTGAPGVKLFPTSSAASYFYPLALPHRSRLNLSMSL